MKIFKEQYIHNISEDGGKQQKDSKVVAWGAGLRRKDRLEFYAPILTMGLIAC